MRNMRQLLAIIPDHDTLNVLALGRSLSGCRILASFKTALNRNDPAPALADLLTQAERQGFSLAKSQGLLCLPPDTAIFHDFQLPTANARTAKKSLALLLESEFPFNLEDFAWRPVYNRAPHKKMVETLVTLVPRKTLSLWQKALEEAGAGSVDAYISPWPFLPYLPKLRMNALFICALRDVAVLCAFNEKGQIIRIQQFFLDQNLPVDKGALEICRKSRLLLAGLPFAPLRALLYSPGRSLASELEKEFDMPVIKAGEDFPLAGRFTLLDANDPCRLLAIAMAAQNPFSRFKIPVFKHHAAHSGNGLLTGKAWLPASAISILLLCMGVAFLLDSLDMRAKSDHLRNLMLRDLKAALPDAPRNASVGRLRAILNSRIQALESGASAATPQIVMTLLEEIHARTPASLRIDIHRFGLDDSHVRLYGRAANFEEVNAIKDNLGNVPGLTGSRIVNAAARAEKEKDALPYVEFEIDLAREKK